MRYLLLLLLLTSPASAEERGPYLHLLGTASVGRSLRFNNPFRLEEPLGQTPESVSLAAAYLDLSLGVFLGLPWGGQHGLWVHHAAALTGIDQTVIAPSYAYLWRFDRGHAFYGRLGPSIVTSPEVNVGAELGAGGVYMVSGLFGLNAELVGAAYYGAATRQVAATLVPLLSFQAGVVIDWEALP
ncbi:MAG: hypothetical protein RMJ98_04350 [Myxococcales bacterium]|nr:hypothetical protein [Polyangiaceae bacterium]MDW8248522.1 hypothetical protein [Myxococcales bacterium]